MCILCHCLAMIFLKPHTRTARRRAKTRPRKSQLQRCTSARAAPPSCHAHKIEIPRPKHVRRVVIYYRINNNTWFDMVHYNVIDLGCWWSRSILSQSATRDTGPTNCPTCSCSWSRARRSCGPTLELTVPCPPITPVEIRKSHISK